MARSAEQSPCRSIPTPRRSRRSLIRAYCTSTYQSQQRRRRSNKRSRSKKAKAYEDPGKQSCCAPPAAMRPPRRRAVSRTRAASPPRDAALLSGRATILDRTAAARVGRIAAQLLPMFLGSEGVLEFLARRAAIDILLRQIDEVLLAKATFRLRARGHRLGQRHGDPRAIASQDLIADEVATIGDGIELIGLQNGLRFVGDVRKL